MLTLSTLVRITAGASLLALGFLACGGRQLGGIPDAGGEGSGGSDGSRNEGGTCVDIVLATYDQSCVVDSDCITISSGEICDGDCRCGGSTININGQARYEAAISPLSGASVCACAFGGAPQCVQGTCSLCAGSSGPGCGDGGISSFESSVSEGSTGIYEGGYEGGYYESGSSEGSTGGGEASACVDIVVSSYDQSCKTSADCVGITAGTLCSGSCDCGGSTINKDGIARYDAAISGLTFSACPCVAAGKPECVFGSCTICGFGSKTPGCPDAGP